MPTSLCLLRSSNHEKKKEQPWLLFFLRLPLGSDLGLFCRYCSDQRRTGIERRSQHLRTNAWLRAPARKQRAAGDQTGAPLEGEIGPGPGKEDSQPVPKAHQEEKMDRYP